MIDKRVLKLLEIKLLIISNNLKLEDTKKDYNQLKTYIDSNEYYPITNLTASFFLKLNETKQKYLENKQISLEKKYQKTVKKYSDEK